MARQSLMARTLSSPDSKRTTIREVSTMTQGKWTAGPWHDSWDNSILCITSCQHEAGPMGSGSDVDIAFMANSDGLLGTKESVFANARLIAEAPAMAGLLSDLAHILADHAQYDSGEESAEGAALARIRTILARINGEGE